MSKITTHHLLLRVAKRCQTTSAEERSNEKLPFLSFRSVQNIIILYIFEAEGGGPLILCFEISDRAKITDPILGDFRLF